MPSERPRFDGRVMIERCPSGALTYAIDGHEGAVEPPLAALVSVVPDGPLFVSGGVPVTRSDGANLETRNRVTLCRCGESKNMPLCDESHKDNGFVSRPSAKRARDARARRPSTGVARQATMAR